MAYTPSGTVPSNYSDLMQAETGRVLPVFLDRGRIRSWWASLGGNGIPSEPWEYEMGDTLSRNILERTIPTPGVGSGWQTVSSNGPTSNSNNCGSNPLQILNASNLRTTQLQQEWLDSDVLCVNNLRSKLSVKRDVEHVVKNLADNVADEWEKQNRRQYGLAAQNHIVFNPQFPLLQNAANPYDFAAAAATSPISQLYLDRLRVQLKQNAAGYDGGAYGREDGNDVFACVMSTEMQQALFQLSGINGTNGNWGWNNGSRINWDRRYAEPNKLLKAFGVNRSYMGWFHIIDDKAPRFTYANGVYTEVPFYISTQASIGNQAIVNPDYWDAPYELVIPFLPTVVKRMVPKVFTTAGSGSSFKAWDYTGQPQWMNYFDRQYNPNLQNGYWSVVLSAGWMPEMIENGYLIMCQRPCNSELELVTCTGGISGNFIG
jgi:hypothetical protein